MLTKADLLKPKTKKIPVDDGEILIRALSAAYAMGLRGKDLQGSDIFQIIADSIVDEQGSTILTADEVGSLSISTLAQITNGIFAFNKLGEKAAAEAVTELKKTDDLIMNSAGHWERPPSK